MTQLSFNETLAALEERGLLLANTSQFSQQVVPESLVRDFARYLRTWRTRQLCAIPVHRPPPEIPNRSALPEVVYLKGWQYLTQEVLNLLLARAWRPAWMLLPSLSHEPGRSEGTRESLRSPFGLVSSINSAGAKLDPSSRESDWVCSPRRTTSMA